MDPSQFDRLVAVLARPASRRATLATLLGGALAGALERTPPDAAATGDGPPARRRCPSEKQHCHGHCHPQHRPCRHPGGCAATGQPCQHHRQCCTDLCDTGVCIPATGCTATGSSCRQHSDCCSGQCAPETGTCQDACGECPTGQVCCGAGETAACCDPRSCCLAAGSGGGLQCCPRPTCCLIQTGPVCCLGICEVDGSGNFACRD